jgi:two-component system, cell cycle response regulator
MSARILVVDDNLLNRKLACDLLELEGHQVQRAEDAAQARSMLERGLDPALILMDISLPGIDGLAFTRELKADLRFAHIPVVAVTAFAMKGDEQKALAAGCVGYITKPIDTRRLPLQVAEVLAAHPQAQPRAPLRIMIVEDHRVDMKLAGERARLSGHVVTSNTSAEEALESLREELPDVVLLDLNLPTMDGLSFLHLLRAKPETEKLPVVAVTAHPDQFEAERLLAAGCNAYLVKPVDSRHLMSVLEAACQSRR